MESVPALFMWKIKSRENKIQKGVLINDKEMERSMFLDAYVILTWTYAYHVHLPNGFGRVTFSINGTKRLLMMIA